ncbi:hypothetical protein QBC46DRAFT_366496 [Diplogelasinospora grovesii]|uniref:Thioester reductase (TE) domain-containing protein n=1 Tax=Diplogelasinospora grovesii TaxID=303347 RepID=A0AAN6N1E0_9PEZI|nr:hypothetical protein QBC46DRAFT_366496 [Diplogelasinospora grovesii]
MIQSVVPNDLYSLFTLIVILTRYIPRVIGSRVEPIIIQEMFPQRKGIYNDLDKQPIDCRNKLPPRLERRYIVTGGNGLAREVDFTQTDITSAAAVDAAFQKPWDRSTFHLPLTVFHTAAVILASDRSKYLYGFPVAVNVEGTGNVWEAARAAGADVFSSTSRSSTSKFWAKEPWNFWQILDERDFVQRPERSHEDFFGNYPASKVVAERLVCPANCDSGVYGNPTDNTVGGPLSQPMFPTWVPHIVQSFVHGANVAIAHLHHEAPLLAKNGMPPQAGRPFVVTDPNPPISYRDLYTAISTLSVHPFQAVVLLPVLILALSHLVEWYNLLPYRVPMLRRILQEIKGDVRHLHPGLFSICT